MKKIHWATGLMGALVFGFVCVGDVAPPKSEAYPPRIWNRGFGTSVQVSPRGIYVGPGYQNYRPSYYGGYQYNNRGYYNRGFRYGNYGFTQPSYGNYGNYGNNYGGSYYGTPYNSGFGFYTN